MKKYLWMIFFTLFLAVTLNAGWVIEYEYTRPESESYISTLYIDKGKLVQESEKDIFIFNYETEEVRIISHKEKSYYDGSIDEFLSFASSMKAQIEESMKNIPAEQRKMVEQMMGNRQPKITIKNTGETAKILGYKTIIYEQEVISPGMMGMGGTTYKTKEYISKDFLEKVVLKEIGKKDIDRISKKLKKAMSQFGTFNNNFNVVGETEGGVSLKSITYNADGDKESETKIVSVKTGKIPSSVLTPPSTYKRRTLKDFYKH